MIEVLLQAEVLERMEKPEIPRTGVVVRESLGL